MDSCYRLKVAKLNTGIDMIILNYTIALLYRISRPTGPFCTEGPNVLVIAVSICRISTRLGNCSVISFVSNCGPKLIRSRALMCNFSIAVLELSEPVSHARMNLTRETLHDNDGTTTVMKVSGHCFLHVSHMI